MNRRRRRSTLRRPPPRPSPLQLLPHRRPRRWTRLRRLPYALPIDAGVVPDNDAVYQTLLAKTDFESTPTAATIHKFLDPLKAIPDTVMPSN